MRFMVGVVCLCVFCNACLQALVHVTYQFYVNKKNLMKAQARAELETAASTAARVLADDDGDSLNEVSTLRQRRTNCKANCG